MKQAKRMISLLAALCLCGCANAPEKTKTSMQAESSLTSQKTEVSNSEMFTQRDLDPSWDEKTAVKIQLNGKSATCSDSSVSIDGSTLTLKGEKTYVLSGSLEDGMVVIDAPETAKVQLVLQDATLSNSTGAAIYIRQADKVFVTLEGENTIKTGETMEAIDENNIDAAIFSKADLTFNGNGSINLEAKGGHAITGKDDVVFTGGTYQLTAASHGVDANDSIRIRNTNLTVDSQKDGLHCENTEDESKGFIYVESGTLDLKVQGDGLDSSGTTDILDGTFHIVSGEGAQTTTTNAQIGRGGPAVDTQSAPTPSEGNTNDMPKGGMSGENGRPQRPGEENDLSSGNSSGFAPNDQGGFDPGQRGVEAFDEPSGMTPPDQETLSSENTGTASTSMKGIKADQNLTISGGEFTLDTEDDGLHCASVLTINGGTFTISSGDDGLHSDEDLVVSNGQISIEQSYEGLEALHLTIEGGQIQIVASDDGLNAAGGQDSSGFTGRNERFAQAGGSQTSQGSIEITGGDILIQAGGDGIDANGSLSIDGGKVIVNTPIQGDTATLDYDQTGTISGGTFIGTGAAGMAQTFSQADQGVISVKVGQQQAKTRLQLLDGNGNVLLEQTPSEPYEVVILSDSQIKSGSSYTLKIGDTSLDVTAK